MCDVGLLPRVCYERCTINPTAATFLLSAMWHGVYPGYYLTFLTGIVMTMAARAVSTDTVSVWTAVGNWAVFLFFVFFLARQKF